MYLLVVWNMESSVDFHLINSHPLLHLYTPNIPTHTTSYQYIIYTTIPIYNTSYQHIIYTTIPIYNTSYQHVKSCEPARTSVFPVCTCAHTKTRLIHETTDIHAPSHQAYTSIIIITVRMLLENTPVYMYMPSCIYMYAALYYKCS